MAGRTAGRTTGRTTGRNSRRNTRINMRNTNDNAKNYSECGKVILDRMYYETFDDIYNANSNYDDKYGNLMSVMKGWIGKSYAGESIFENIKGIYDDHIKKFNIVNLDFPLFHSPTVSLVELNYNTITKQMEMIPLYREIKPTDRIRIWRTLNQNGDAGHVSSEIITETGKHFSFGFAYSSEIRGLLSTGDLILLSPDTQLNQAISRQIDHFDMSYRYLELVHESVIGEESFDRLVKLFDATFNSSSGLDKLATISINANYLKVDKSKKAKMVDYVKSNSTDVKTSFFRMLESENIRTRDNYIKKLRPDLEKEYNRSEYLLTLTLTTVWNITDFLGYSCGYRLASGRLINRYKSVKNTITRRTTKKGINCVYGAHLLFKDLIKCGKFIVTPKKCKSRKAYNKCLIEYSV
jgi:hypothetical protein